MIKETDNHLNLKEYLYRVRWTIIGIAAITFLTHGSILFSQRFGIDTENIMIGAHNFTKIGRPGLVWLAKFLELDWFNLYLAQVLVLLFMTLFPVSAGYLFSRIGRQTEYLNLSLLVLGLSVVVSPFWVEQIYFLNQSPQILLACVLIPITVLFVEAARTDIRHKWYCLILAIALMQIIFACYQSLITVYITTVTAAFLFSFLKEANPLKKGFQWIGFHAGAFCVGFVLYRIITVSFYLIGSDYLTGQLSWGKMGAADVIRNILRGIKRSLGDNPPYYTGMYGVFCLLLAGSSLYLVIRKKELKYLLFLAAEAFLMFTPYVFSLIYGGEVLARIQLTMPLSQGCILYLTILLWSNRNASDSKADKKILRLFHPQLLGKAVALILAVCLCRDTLSNLNYCTRFYYTDEWQYQYTKDMAQEILTEIEEVRKQNGLDPYYSNIVFLGSPSIPYNATCLPGQGIGISSFNWVTNRISRYTIFGLYENTGHPLYTYFAPGATAAFFAYFQEYFGDAVDGMPAYPMEGCVQYLQNDEIGLDYIVVKLEYRWRENLWPEED